MKTMCASLAFMFASVSQAQTAKVISLSPEDAAQAKSLYVQKVDIEKKLADLQKTISDKYLSREDEQGPLWGCLSSSSFIKINGNGTVSSTDKDKEDLKKCEEERAKAPKTKVKVTKDGWSSGFEFSDDFKFVVPKSTPISGSGTFQFGSCPIQNWINPVGTSGAPCTNCLINSIN